MGRCPRQRILDLIKKKTNLSLQREFLFKIFLKHGKRCSYMSDRKPRMLGNYEVKKGLDFQENRMEALKVSEEMLAVVDLKMLIE